MGNSLKFGTSGLRGLAIDLVGTEARRYTAAFIAHLRSRRTVSEVLIGMDLRDTSPEVAASVRDAIAAAGSSPIDCGALPTPALALEATERSAPAVMVTGSHVPRERNGLKFYTEMGEITKADEAAITTLLAPDIAVRGVALWEPHALRRYCARYLKILPARVFEGWRIGVWQHSSVARDVLAEMLGHFGAEVVLLGRENTFLAVDTEAISGSVAATLAGWVRSHRLDALVSTDGDADRPIVVDEMGAVVRGDTIGVLTARYLSADTVVTTVTANSSIEETKLFRDVIRTKVGSPHVIAGMAEAQGRVVGFEPTGGVLLGTSVVVNGEYLKALPTRDALLPILATLAIARAARETISQACARLPIRHTRSNRLENVAPERVSLLMGRLQDDAAIFFAEQGRIKRVSMVDGMRFELDRGVIHFRASGTAPELRCYTEASTAKSAEELLEWGLSAASAIVR